MKHIILIIAMAFLVSCNSVTGASRPPETPDEPVELVNNAGKPKTKVTRHWNISEHGKVLEIELTRNLAFKEFKVLWYMKTTGDFHTQSLTDLGLMGFVSYATDKNFVRVDLDGMYKARLNMVYIMTLELTEMAYLLSEVETE